MAAVTVNLVSDLTLIGSVQETVRAKTRRDASRAPAGVAPMRWDSDANAPAPANLSDPEGCNRETTANDFHPLAQHAVLAEQLQTTLFLSRGFSHQAQRTKALPEGAGK